MCAGLCPTYATALDSAEENRNGRRLSCSRRNPQNWYYVTQFLAHPVEPHERLVHQMLRLDRGGINFFAYATYIPLFLIVSDIYGRKSRNGEKNEIFSNFLAHPVETPWPISTFLHQNVRRSVSYIFDYIWHR